MAKTKTTDIYNIQRDDIVVYESNDYDMFVHIEGNRELDEKHVNELVESMREHNGWVGAPAQVNPDGGISDGQHRIEAAKRCGFPVLYITEDNITIEDIAKRNETQKPWTLIDYIKSFAARGNENYQWVLDTHQLFPQFKISIILELANGTGYRTDLKGTSKANIIQGGLFTSEEKKEHVINVLKFLANFNNVVETSKGRSFMFYNALIWWYFESSCDIDRLITTVNKYAHNDNVFKGRLSMQDFVYGIQEAYNFNRPMKNRLFIKNEFDKFDNYEDHSF